MTRTRIAFSAAVMALMLSALSVASFFAVSSLPHYPAVTAAAMRLA